MLIKTDFFNIDKVKMLQTTRIGGKSGKPYDSFNFGIYGKDPDVRSNIDLLTQQQGLPHTPCFLKQIHTDKVIEYKSVPDPDSKLEADACFTRKKGIICSVMTADCLPVLITDKSSTVVAAVHCGWRSLHAEILRKTITKMDVNAEELLCWMGPCISYKPYTVGQELREKFTQLDNEFSHCFYRDEKGKWHADLKKIAAHQLQSLGVSNISQSPYCTFENKGLFYSYRRDGETGRMASLIWIKS